MRLLVICCGLCLMLLPALAGARTVYVTDTLEITMRSAPSVNRKIIKMIPSGTALTILDQTKSWYKVRTRDGQTGWVLKRYIMQDVPKEAQISSLRDKIKTLEKSQTQGQDMMQKLRAENKRLHASLEQAKNKLTQVSSDHQKLRTKVHSLRSGQDLRWFLSGAGVVGLSALIGFVFGRFRSRQPTTSSRRVYF